MQANRASGFTLAELAIVLVILGLLVGGIIAGKSLVHSSELNAVMQEQQKYKSAIVEFHDQYQALPGDMLNATQYWGTQDSSLATCRSTPSTNTSTCNGNGDGHIDNTDSTDQWYESYRAWQHLVNAGLITGFYSGSPGTTALNVVAGVNVPSSRMHGVWVVEYLAGRAQTSWAPVEAANYLILGNADASGDWKNPVLRPEDAFSIDTKIDDGMPYTGKVNDTMTNTYTPNCTTDETTTGAYNLQFQDAACILMFRAY